MDERRCNVRYLNMQLGLPAIIVNLVTFLYANIQTQGTVFSQLNQHRIFILVKGHLEHLFSYVAIL